MLLSYTSTCINMTTWLFFHTRLGFSLSLTRIIQLRCTVFDDMFANITQCISGNAEVH